MLKNPPRSQADSLPSLAEVIGKTAEQMGTRTPLLETSAHPLSEQQNTQRSDQGEDRPVRPFKPTLWDGILIILGVLILVILASRFLPAPSTTTQEPEQASSIAAAQVPAQAPAQSPAGQAITTARAIVPRWAPGGDPRLEAIERGTTVQIAGQHHAWPGWVMITGKGVPEPSWVQLTDLTGAIDVAKVPDLAPPTPAPAPAQAAQPAYEPAQAEPIAQPTQCVTVGDTVVKVTSCGTIGLDNLKATAQAEYIGKVNAQWVSVATTTPYPTSVRKP